MSRFSQIFSWLSRRDRDEELRSWFRRQPLPPVSFSEIQSVDRPPQLEDVEGNTFYFVFSMNRPKWVLFQCPCGCNNVITLSLQKSHRPHWILRKSKRNRPILYPSVWRDVDCMSHFWIKDGRVYWCHDTGTTPFTKYFSG